MFLGTTSAFFNEHSLSVWDKSSIFPIGILKGSDFSGSNSQRISITALIDCLYSLWILIRKENGITIFRTSGRILVEKEDSIGIFQGFQAGCKTSNGYSDQKNRWFHLLAHPFDFVHSVYRDPLQTLLL